MTTATTSDTCVEECPIPHDPTEASGSQCPICDVPWPCPERKRQRIEKRAIENYLRSDLYDVARDRPRPRIDGVEAVRWVSPLNWSADLTYGEHGLVVIVHSYDGDHRNDDADVAWLDRVLP